MRCGKSTFVWLKISHLVVDFQDPSSYPTVVIARNVTFRIATALADRPVVLLHGARQTGKSTLAQQIAAQRPGSRYVTLDDLTARAAAQNDPSGFLAGMDGTVVLDEVQRVPELFLAIKAEVDRRRQPGRFLLTGSANILSLPSIAQALAGRMEIVTLWPFSQGELEARMEGFLDAVFGSEPPRGSAARSKESLEQRVVRGGFPEVVTALAPNRRAAWFEAYVTTVLHREVPELARIEGLTALPRLLQLVAARPMALLNYADLSRSCGIPQTTLKRYLALFEALFLVRTLPPWHGNIGKRLSKTPKLFLTDTGLASFLLGLDAARLQRDRTLVGPLLENFVAMELTKQLSWHPAPPSMYFFRVHEGPEVDFVLEQRSGTLVGIEVKASTTVGPGDFRGLQVLAQAVGRRFHRGIVLYTGSEVVPFASNLFAIPLEFLWTWNAKPKALTRPRRAVPAKTRQKLRKSSTVR